MAIPIQEIVQGPIPVEILGISASILVGISITMRKVKWLRIINLIGSLLFVIYGFCIHSLAVVILNCFTIVVHTFYLWHIRLKAIRQEMFNVVFTGAGFDEYVAHFLLYYADDIAKFFPSFNSDPGSGTIVGAEYCFILRETLPVSLVAFTRESPAEIRILLDYAIPRYRDFRNARFFFDTVISRIAAPGTVITAAGEVPAHASYLRRMGFEETGSSGSDILFRKQI